MNNKPTYIIDATPIIHFARIGKLGLIPKICHPIIVESVYKETAHEEYPDGLIVKDFVEAETIKVQRVEDRTNVEALLRTQGIHLGEAETLAAAKSLDCTAIMDDSEARAVAEVYGIKSAPGTLYLLFKLLSNKIISIEEAEDMLVKLVKNGLYLDSKTIIRARARIRELNATKHKTKSTNPDL